MPLMGRRWLLIGVLAAAIIGSVAASSATPATPSPSISGPPRSQSEEGDRMGNIPETAQQVRAFCADRFPSHFTSVVIAEDQHSLVVYRRPGADLDGQVRARFPDVSIGFRDAEHSLQQLEQVQKRVMADTADWRLKGIEITTVGLSEDKVVVGVRPGQANEARDVLRQRYGTMIIVREREVELLGK